MRSVSPGGPRRLVEVLRRLAEGDLDEVHRVLAAKLAERPRGRARGVALPALAGAPRVAADLRPAGVGLAAEAGELEADAGGGRGGEAGGQAQVDRRDQGGPSVDDRVLAHEDELARGRDGEGLAARRARLPVKDHPGRLAARCGSAAHRVCTPLGGDAGGGGTAPRPSFSCARARS